MKQKLIYEAPAAELFEIRMEAGFLTNSVEVMNSVTGSWDEEDW